MVRVFALLTLLALLAVADVSARPYAPAGSKAVPATGQPTFVVTGHGWGHGVGMSQWGAYGFATRGWTYERILAHYYRGTTLGAAPVSRLRVLLGEGRASVRISSPVPFTVRGAGGAPIQLEPRAYAFGPGLRVRAGEAPLTGPLLFAPGAGAEPLLLDGRPYRGQLEVAVVAGKLRIVNVVGLEAYLSGGIPYEVPSTWPDEALKAQAVVARSYALASRRTGPFDLYADVRSQVYGGVRSEEPTTTTAIGETSGQVLLYGGRVAQTFFFSTSGGRTAESAADTWSGEPVPYLVSVPDPYDTASPHHSWGPVAFTGPALAKKLGVKGRVLDVRTTVNASQRVNLVTVVTDLGETEVRGGDVRTKLGLRSTWFRFGALALQKPVRPIETGGAVTLVGTARGLAATLEAKPYGGQWAAVGAVKPGADGAVATRVKPAISTEYRLASGSVRTPPARVLVSPRVRLSAPTSPTSLSGTVTPAMTGATVAIQRRDDAGAWRTLATLQPAANGAFTARLALEPGSYRARYAPGRGYAVGLSRLLEVRPA